MNEKEKKNVNQFNVMCSLPDEKLNWPGTIKYFPLPFVFSGFVAILFNEPAFNIFGCSSVTKIIIFCV